MVVGLPFSGKTSALKVLAQSLTELNEKGLMKEMKTHI
jgi:dynein heavy chain